MPKNVSLLQIVNLRDYELAVQEAPRMVFGAIRREFKRAGNRWRVKAANQLLAGPPGIHLPAKERRRKNRKPLRSVSKKNVKFQHVRVRTGGRRDIFLVGYTSTFLTYHKSKIRPLFEQSFNEEIKGIESTVQSEAARITQVVLDRHLGRGLRFLGGIGAQAARRV